MISGVLIALTVLAGFLWAPEFIMAPQWFRVSVQLSLAVILTCAVYLDYSGRE